MVTAAVTNDNIRAGVARRLPCPVAISRALGALRDRLASKLATVSGL
jgi:hypothetical protein